MKTAVSLALLVVVTGSAVMLSAEQPPDAVLAEMKKCAVCKSMAENPKFMTQMTWETHKIDNGMLCVSTLPKESMKEFTALHKKIEQNISQVKTDAKEGKKVELCSFCEGMAALEKAGAKQQVILLSNGGVNLITSTDPEVVKKIHSHADEAIAMQKQMQQPAK